MINDPDLLILDEPFMGVDPAGSVSLRKEIRRLADQGSAVMVSSHTLGLIEKVADRIIVMNKGKIVVRGSLDQLRRTFGEQKDLEQLFMQITKSEEKEPVDD